MNALFQKAWAWLKAHPKAFAAVLIVLAFFAGAASGHFAKPMVKTDIRTIEDTTKVDRLQEQLTETLKSVSNLKDQLSVAQKQLKDVQTQTKTVIKYVRLPTGQVEKDTTITRDTTTTTDTTTDTKHDVLSTNTTTDNKSDTKADSVTSTTHTDTHTIITPIKDRVYVGVMLGFQGRHFLKPDALYSLGPVVPGVEVKGRIAQSPFWVGGNVNTALEFNLTAGFSW